MGAMKNTAETAKGGKVGATTVAITESNRKGEEAYDYAFESSEFFSLLHKQEESAIRWFWSAACNGLTHRSSFPSGNYGCAQQIVDAIVKCATKARATISKLDQERGKDLFNSVTMAGLKEEFPALYGLEFSLDNCILAEHRARLEREEAKRAAEKAAAAQQAAALAEKLAELRAAKAAKEGK